MTAEEFIKDCTRGCSNELVAVEDRCGKQVISYHEWLTPNQALRAVEIARRDTLLAIKHEIDMCSVKQYQFPILHLLDYIDKELGLKSKEK